MITRMHIMLWGTRRINKELVSSVSAQMKDTMKQRTDYLWIFFLNVNNDHPNQTINHIYHT